jgi:hypothetical protein
MTAMTTSNSISVKASGRPIARTLDIRFLIFVLMPVVSTAIADSWSHVRTSTV